MATVPPLLPPSAHPPPSHLQASTAVRSTRTLEVGETAAEPTSSSPKTMCGASTQLTLRSRTPRARPRLCSSVSCSHLTLALVMASTCGRPPRPESRRSSHDSLLKPTSATALFGRFSASVPGVSYTTSSIETITRRTTIITEVITDRPYYCTQCHEHAIDEGERTASQSRDNCLVTWPIALPHTPDRSTTTFGSRTADASCRSSRRKEWRRPRDARMRKADHCICLHHNTGSAVHLDSQQFALHHHGGEGRGA